MEMPAYKVEKLAARERIAFLAEELRETEGRLSDGIRARFRERFGRDVEGPTVRAARVSLGLTSNPKAAAAPVVPGELREALNMVGHVERLQAQQIALEEQIEDLEAKRDEVKRQIDAYKPVLGQLRALQQAVNVVRTKAEH
jgi:hypothetical protein